MEEIVKSYPNPYPYQGSEGAASASRMTWVSPSRVHAHNKAYDEFKESVGATAQLAVDIIERQKSVDMIAKRAAQLYRFTRHLAHFRFSEAARELGLQVTKRKGNRYWVRGQNRTLLSGKDGSARRDPFLPYDGPTREIILKRKAKSFGSNFLEFHFGWAPTVKGIGESMEVLQSPTTPHSRGPCKGKGFHKTPYPPTGTAGSVVDYGKPRYSVYNVHGWMTGVVIRGNVKVIDPNLYKWNAMGLVNPASIVWELIPFSFIVDWFANVGQCLAAWNDFVGLELSEVTETEFTRIQRDSIYRADWTVYLSMAHYEYVQVKRTLGLTTPTLVLRPPKWPSVTRGLTAISLLTLALRRN